MRQGDVNQGRTKQRDTGSGPEYRDDVVQFIEAKYGQFGVTATVPDRRKSEIHVKRTGSHKTLIIFTMTQDSVGSASQKLTDRLAELSEHKTQNPENIEILFLFRGSNYPGRVMATIARNQNLVQRFDEDLGQVAPLMEKLNATFGDVS